MNYLKIQNNDYQLHFVRLFYYEYLPIDDKLQQSNVRQTDNNQLFFFKKNQFKFFISYFLPNLFVPVKSLFGKYLKWLSTNGCAFKLQNPMYLKSNILFYLNITIHIYMYILNVLFYPNYIDDDLERNLLNIIDIDFATF